jgi:hypothetical protein
VPYCSRSSPPFLGGRSSRSRVSNTLRGSHPPRNIPYAPLGNIAPYFAQIVVRRLCPRTIELPALLGVVVVVVCLAVWLLDVQPGLQSLPTLLARAIAPECHIGLTCRKRKPIPSRTVSVPPIRSGCLRSVVSAPTCAVGPEGRIAAALEPPRKFPLSALLREIPSRWRTRHS